MLRRLRFPPLRRRKNVKVKEERRWLRDKDRFAQTKTNEPPLHPWLSKGRAYELLKEEERLRNLHPFTLKYNPEVLEEFTSKAEAYCLYKTHKMIQDTAEVKNVLDAGKQAMQHLSTLPTNLAIELHKPDKKYLPPAHLHHEYLYWPQISKIIPPELQRNWGVALRLEDIAHDRIPFHEE